ncbi:MAG: dTMP kinase [Candidatus Hydrogenedentota bacterium]
MQGCFITFEGVEGSGKSTQIALLREWLESRGYPVTATREPGGSPVAEGVRNILLDPAMKGMAPAAELLLYTAARADHVANVVRPALDNGRIVLCDRYVDSTIAYQGHARGLGESTIRRLHALGVGNLWPVRTFLLDLAAETGLERVRGRGRSDRLEQETLTFHARVRTAFLALGNAEPQRITIVDGTMAVDAIATAIRRDVANLLEGCGAG